MEAKAFLPDYNCVPWNGRYRPVFRLFAGERWRMVRANKAPVECDTPSQAITAAKDHVKRILNPVIRSETAEPEADPLGVDAWRQERAGRAEQEQREAFGTIFVRSKGGASKSVVVETRRLRACSQ